MGKVWRLIIDSDSDGFYNMAEDEAIFSFYQKARIPTLRIYSWSRPFITLGYFQTPSKVLKIENLGKNKIEFTRRITGGFAILHFYEITYSLSLSCKDLNLPRGVKDSYFVLTSFILNFYKRLGIKNVRFAHNLSNSSKNTNFCFASFEPYDILIEGKKIGGNAQYRRRELIFQQGSIPLKLDFFLIEKLINVKRPLEAQGLSYFLNKDLDKEGLKHKLAQAFEEEFGIDLTLSSLDDEEKKETKRLMEEKYTQRFWKFKNEETLLVK